MNDFNQQIIEEFRANAGHVGGMFDEMKTDRPIPVVILEPVGERADA